MCTCSNSLPIVFISVVMTSRLVLGVVMDRVGVICICLVVALWSLLTLVLEVAMFTDSCAVLFCTRKT